MKTKLNIVVTLFSALLAFASCSKNNDGIEKPSSRIVGINITDETKLIYGVSGNGTKSSNLDNVFYQITDSKETIRMVWKREDGDTTVVRNIKNVATINDKYAIIGTDLPLEDESNLGGGTNISIGYFGAPYLVKKVDGSLIPIWHEIKLDAMPKFHTDNNGDLYLIDLGKLHKYDESRNEFELLIRKAGEYNDPDPNYVIHNDIICHNGETPLFKPSPYSGEYSFFDLDNKDKKQLTLNEIIPVGDVQLPSEHYTRKTGDVYPFLSLDGTVTYTVFEQYDDAISGGNYKYELEIGIGKINVSGGKNFTTEIIKRISVNSSGSAVRNCGIIPNHVRGVHLIYANGVYEFRESDKSFNEIDDPDSKIYGLFNALEKKKVFIVAGLTLNSGFYIGDGKLTIIDMATYSATTIDMQTVGYDITNITSFSKEDDIVTFIGESFDGKEYAIGTIDMHGNVSIIRTIPRGEFTYSDFVIAHM